MEKSMMQNCSQNSSTSIYKIISIKVNLFNMTRIKPTSYIRKPKTNKINFLRSSNINNQICMRFSVRQEFKSHNFPPNQFSDIRRPLTTNPLTTKQTQLRWGHRLRATRQPQQQQHQQHWQPAEPPVRGGKGRRCWCKVSVNLLI